MILLGIFYVLYFSVLHEILLHIMLPHGVLCSYDTCWYYKPIQATRG